MNSSREIKSNFLLAMTLTVCGASIVLAVAEGTMFPVALTPVFAVVAAVWNEHRRWLVLPVLLANICGVIAVFAAGAELVLGTVEARILSGAHLSIYLTWIVLFMRKQDRQYWWLVALSVLQLAVASVLTKAPYLGLSLIGMMILIVWTLSLFTLLRLKNRAELGDVAGDDAQGPPVDSAIGVRHGIQTDSGVRWINLRFRLMVLGMCLASLLMSGVVFAVFPRVFVGTPGFLNDFSREHGGIIQRTGFRDRVKLGEFGPILKSDERVLQLQAVDQKTGREMTMDEVADRLEMDELRLWGNSMARYSGGIWSGAISDGELSEFNLPYQDENTSPVDCIRFEITQEAPIGTFAFVPTPVVSSRLLNAEGRLMQRSLSESLVFDLIDNRAWQAGASSDYNVDSIKFEVYCESPASYERRFPPDEIVGPLRQWLYPRSRLRRWQPINIGDGSRFWVTPDLEEHVPATWKMAQQLCYDDGRRVSVVECVQRINAVLRESGQYQYTLDMAPADTSLDPLDDFLINHKTGHCQYFASAGALMLQSVGIPARIVNGFKGTHENPDTGIAEVRQKHAHVWVEYRHNDLWHTMDPTPATRNEFLSIEDQQSVLVNIQKAVSNLWESGINNVTPERQRAAIQPLLEVWKSGIASIGKHGILGAIRAFIDDVRSNPSAWISWKLLAGTFVVLLPMALLFRNRPWRWIRSLIDRLSPKRRTATHIVRFYENFRKACSRSGLDFPPSHTAFENAMSAEQYFREQLTPDIKGIPVRIAHAFNAVRYGDHLLTPEQTDRLGHDVVLLTSAISSVKSRPKT